MRSCNIQSLIIFKHRLCATTDSFSAHCLSFGFLDSSIRVQCCGSSWLPHTLHTPFGCINSSKWSKNSTKKILLLRSALVQIFANRDFWPITALCETNDIISGCIMWQVLSAINFIDGALRMHRYRHV